MRYALALMMILSAQAASAHVGHLGEFAGHDHWVAGAALGIAIALGIREALKGRKTEEPKEEIEDDAEEAAA